ncbi:unnamed protein product, partial [marine sediment metagenome]
MDTQGVVDSLQAVLSSDMMADSPRLQELLRYIVEETLKGRENQIVGKAIAQSVYGRDLERGYENDSIVRVDAGRLRKKLESYYQKSGKSDTY